MHNSIGWITTPAGTGRGRAVANAQWADWSPDGRRLVYSTRVDGDWEIWSAKTDGSAARVIVGDPREQEARFRFRRGSRATYHTCTPESAGSVPVVAHRGLGAAR